MLLAFLLCTGSRAFAITYTFTGAGSWSTVGNWNANGIPPNPLLSGDTIIIDGTGAALLDINQTIKIGSYLSINSSKSLTINSSKTLTVNETSLVINLGGTLNNNGIISLNESIPNVTQGNLNNYGSLYNNAGSTLNIFEGSGLSNTNPGGILQNDGTINVLGGLYSASLSNDNGNLTNNNIMHIDSISSLTNNGIGVLINSSTGILSITRNSNLSNISAATLINNGTLSINHNCMLTNFTVATLTNNGLLTNNGNIENQNILRNNSTLNNNGYLRNNILDSLFNSGTLNNNGTIENDGALINTGTISQGGAYKGMGTFGGSLFTNTGTLAPGASPGCLGFDAGYTNMGTLQMEINGATACTQFDQLNVTGTATAGGTLAVTFGITPTIGQTFQIINASSYGGNFSSISSTPAHSISYLNGVITVNSVLPIKLLSFNAALQQNDVRLNWKTADAINFSHFVIERSTDGVNFILIGQKNAINGSGELRYDYTDANAVIAYRNNGNGYYRIKMVDIDGKFSYSNIVRINFKNDNGLFVISTQPNPFTDKISISLSIPESEVVTVKLIDIQGRIIRRKRIASGPGFSTIVIDGLEKTGSGIFLLQIQSNQGIVTEKVVKQ